MCFGSSNKIRICDHQPELAVHFLCFHMIYVILEILKGKGHRERSPELNFGPLKFYYSHTNLGIKRPLTTAICYMKNRLQCLQCETQAYTSLI